MFFLPRHWLLLGFCVLGCRSEGLTIERVIDAGELPDAGGQSNGGKSVGGAPGTDAMAACNDWQIEGAIARGRLETLCGDTCPSTLDAALARDSTAQVRQGCGYTELDYRLGFSGVRYVFGAQGGLVGASLYNEVLDGACDVFEYVAGEEFPEQCESSLSCRLWPERDTAEPLCQCSCPDTDPETQLMLSLDCACELGFMRPCAPSFEEAVETARNVPHASLAFGCNRRGVRKYFSNGSLDEELVFDFSGTLIGMRSTSVACGHAGGFVAGFGFGACAEISECALSGSSDLGLPPCE